MTSAILACLIMTPSWGGGEVYSDAGDYHRGPLVIINPYVSTGTEIDCARLLPAEGSVPLRIQNPFVSIADAASKTEPSHVGPFAGHRWGRFTAVRVYPSRKE